MLPKIYSAFLNLTNACNLACRYCFVEQHPDMISLQVAKDAADFWPPTRETGFRLSTFRRGTTTDVGRYYSPADRVCPGSVSSI